MPRFLADLPMDLRFALRAARRNPGTVVAVVVTLAVGIGTVAAVFSVADAVLFRPLPLRDGDRLVRVFKIRDDGPPYISLRPHDVLELRRSAGFYEEIVAQRYTAVILETDDGPRRVVGLGVTEGWTETLGISPAIGRAFTSRELELGREARVVVASHGFWQRRLGSDPDAVGDTLRLDGVEHAVIGVMPPGFSFPYSVELWMPLNLEREVDARWGLNVQARLAPGVSLEEARAELRTIGRRLADRYPATNADSVLIPVPTRRLVQGDEPGRFVALLAAVGFLLAIVCANVAALLVARMSGRRGELAIRAALGADRGRQIRQVLTECLVLGAAGCVAGVALAWLAEGLLDGLLPGRLATLVEGAGVDLRVLAFAGLAGLSATVLFGLPVAVRSTRADLRALIDRNARGVTARDRLLDGIVVAEIALALALLVGAGLTAGNLRRLTRLDPGYPIDGLVTAGVDLDPGRHPGAAERSRFVRRVVAELEALPGVESAGATTIFPSAEGNFLARVEVEGRSAGPEDALVVNHRAVGPGFLETLGAPLIRGRMPDDRDAAGAPPVVVVSRALARRAWSGSDPIGRRVRRATMDGESPWMTVVGVVDDVREFWDMEATWYLPYAQHADDAQAAVLTLAVRADRPDGLSAREIRGAVRAVDPTVPVFDVATVRERHLDSFSEQRLGAWLLAAFAGVGTFVALFGVYGVTAQAVARRRREIGVRVALGASAAGILRWILVRELARTLWGVAIGVALAWGTSRWLASRLSQVEGLSSPLLAAVAVSLIVVALLAAWIPARRALGVDPVSVLRSE